MEEMRNGALFWLSCCRKTLIKSYLLFSKKESISNK
jgi:hypothetical protein